MRSSSSGAVLNENFTLNIPMLCVHIRREPHIIITARAYRRYASSTSSGAKTGTAQQGKREEVAHRRFSLQCVEFTISITQRFLPAPDPHSKCGPSPTTTTTTTTTCFGFMVWHNRSDKILRERSRRTGTRKTPPPPTTQPTRHGLSILCSTINFIRSVNTI